MSEKVRYLQNYNWLEPNMNSGPFRLKRCTILMPSQILGSLVLEKEMF